jgi:hypothetical protein
MLREFGGNLRPGKVIVGKRMYIKHDVEPMQIQYSNSKRTRKQKFAA